MLQGQTVSAIDGSAAPNLTVRVGTRELVTTDGSGFFQVDVGSPGAFATLVRGGGVVERETTVNGPASMKRGADPSTGRIAGRMIADSVSTIWPSSTTRARPSGVHRMPDQALIQGSPDGGDVRKSATPPWVSMRATPDRNHMLMRARSARVRPSGLTASRSTSRIC